MTVAIVTDSGADLTPEQQAEYGIRVVPLTVSFGQESYRGELTPAKFWERMTAPDSPFAATAAPSPAAFAAAYTDAFDSGADEIVVVTLAESLSATIRSAQMAATQFEDRTVRVVDSRCASMGIGLQAIIGAQMAAGGASAAEIATHLEEIAPLSKFYVALDTLEYLRRGGRISGARAAIGTILSVKPIVTIENGVLLAADQPRTRTKARERTIELIAARPLQAITILYSTGMDPVAFGQEVLARLPGEPPRIVTTQIIGPVVGAHIGPGSYGAAFLYAE